MFWRIFRHVFMDEANAGEGGGGGGGGGSQPDAGGAPAGGGQGSNPGDGPGGSGEGSATPQGGVLASGADGEGGQGQALAIPEKYQVKKEDGSLDIEASSLKLAEAYGHLEKKLGSGDVPPKTAEEYQVTVPDALKDHWKPNDDPLFAEFKKDAHAAGLSQKQFDLVMNKYMDLAPKLLEGNRQLSDEECIADLKQEWKTDQQYKAELGKSYKALLAYAGSEDDAQYFLGKYGNDPKFIRMMNRVGAELGEDRSINPGGTLQGGQTVEALMSSEAYTNAKHPDHARVSAQVKAYYDKQAEAAAKAGNIPVL